jgi:hypothetical protein
VWVDDYPDLTPGRSLFLGYSLLITPSGGAYRLSSATVIPTPKSFIYLHKIVPVYHISCRLIPVCVFVCHHRVAKVNLPPWLLRGFSWSPWQPQTCSLWLFLTKLPIRVYTYHSKTLYHRYRGLSLLLVYYTIFCQIVNTKDL